jgi:hypothetical protein
MLARGRDARARDVRAHAHAREGSAAAAWRERTGTGEMQGVILPRAALDRWLQADLARPCFALLWTSGPDPTLDGVVRVLARRRTVTGAWEELDRWCDPRAGTQHELPGQERWPARFGRGAAELAGLPAASALWDELREFLSGGALIVPESASFQAWCAHLAGRQPELPVLVGLAEMAALLHPGRLAQRREELLAQLVEPTAGAGSEAYAPADLALALDELVQRFLEREEDVLRVAVQGFRRAWSGLSTHEPRAAAALNLALSLADRRASWSERDGGARLDRRLAALLEPEVPLEDLLESSSPRWARDLQRWNAFESLPAELEQPAPFAAADLELLERIFREHLPRLFVAGGAPPSYRASQHDVARAVAGALGTRELLLVHAPTGTGKTLAYLVPAMLWARRHGVRVGVATYTRALQEQAMDREVPRALAALARAGVPPGTRVSVLKGRDNYVCWRALKLALPAEDDDGASWLAWTTLVLFALSDLEGDLDRLPLAAPVALEQRAPYLRTLQQLVQHARAQTACCTQREDQHTCGAEAARTRAQRSHVVIVNQAFALARQEYFRHIVFDECEHLHDQAHSAFSHLVSFRDLKSLLGRLSRTPRERSRAILDRIEQLVLEGTPSHACLTRCLDAWAQACGGALAPRARRAGLRRVAHGAGAATRGPRPPLAAARVRLRAGRGRARARAPALHGHLERARDLAGRAGRAARHTSVARAAAPAARARPGAQRPGADPALGRRLDADRRRPSGLPAAHVLRRRARRARRPRAGFARAPAQRVPGPQLLPRAGLGHLPLGHDRAAGRLRVGAGLPGPRPRGAAGRGRAAPAVRRAHLPRAGRVRLLARPGGHPARRAARGRREGRLPRLRAPLRGLPGRAHARAHAGAVHERARHGARGPGAGRASSARARSRSGSRTWRAWARRSWAGCSARTSTRCSWAWTPSGTARTSRARPCSTS